MTLNQTGFCFTCMKAKQLGLLTNTKTGPAFTTKGYNNWENTLDKKAGLYKHPNSDSHKGGGGELNHFFAGNVLAPC